MRKAVMEREEIKDRVTKVVCQVLKVEAAQVQEEHGFVSDLGAESVQSIELMAGFEEEFDIEMDEDEALSVQTVGDAVDFIGKYLD
jgi:acyl carrier protein